MILTVFLVLRTNIFSSCLIVGMTRLMHMLMKLGVCNGVEAVWELLLLCGGKMEGRFSGDDEESHGFRCLLL